MELIVNGQPRTLDDGATVGALVAAVAPQAGRVAVELNGEILPRSEHPKRSLRSGDRIEIVQAIGGG